MLTDRGLKVYTRPDGRIFPHGQTAKDVVHILGMYLEDAKVVVKKECPVTGIKRSSTTRWQIEFLSQGQIERIEADSVVVCTGGSSYPGTGTTGDGWPWAKELGHRIIKVRAALAPIYLTNESAQLAERSGVALRDCMLRARLAGKEIARWTGDLLFTHHGVSGPCALGISRVVAERISEGPITLEIDVIPSRSFEAITEEIIQASTSNPHKTVSGFVEEYLPKSLVEPMLIVSDVAPTTTLGKLDKKARNRLVNAIKAWQIGFAKAVPLEKGEVVAGGISLDEVDPQTLQSKLHSGLYFCGEILDIAGPVGGYNLQAAFATGFCAGEAAVNASFKES